VPPPAPIPDVRPSIGLYKIIPFTPFTLILAPLTPGKGPAAANPPPAPVPPPPEAPTIKALIALEFAPVVNPPAPPLTPATAKKVPKFKSGKALKGLVG
jgi:hypothetical protein